MKLLNMTCPNCGSKLSINKDTGECKCESCGGVFMLDDESTTQHIKYENAEEAGYQFEKGRQKAQKENARNNTTYYTARTTTKAKKKSNVPIWAWILLWMCFWPFLAIYFIYKSNLPEKWKAGLILGIAGIMFVAGIKGCIDKSKEPSDLTQINEVTVQTENSNNIRSFSDSVYDSENTIELNKYDSEEICFTATVSDRNAFTYEDVLFISDNPEVATIVYDHTSMTTKIYVSIEAISEGDTYVYVSSQDGTVESERIHVIVNAVSEVESVSLPVESTTVALGGTAAISVVVEPDDAANRTLTWSSEDSSIVSVDENGVVTGVSVGTATITATSVNGISSNCIVTVDDSLRTFQLSISRQRDDSNSIGDEWSHTRQINGEAAANGNYTLAVGDTLVFYVQSIEDDNNPDVGEATVTHTVTQDDFDNGFVVSVDVYVTENGGPNSGQSAHFITTFAFDV